MLERAILSTQECIHVCGLYRGKALDRKLNNVILLLHRYVIVHLIFHIHTQVCLGKCARELF